MKALTKAQKLLVVERALHISGKNSCTEFLITNQDPQCTNKLERIKKEIEEFNNNSENPSTGESRYYKLAKVCEQVLSVTETEDDKHYINQFKKIANQLIHK